MTSDPLYLTGITGHYASTPDSAAVSVTGDIDIRCKAALADWTPSAQASFVSKNNTAGHRSYNFVVTAAGKLSLISYYDGTNNYGAISSVATGVTDGEVKWVRVTRASSTGTTKFYLSDDGSSWTQLGTDIATTASGLFDSDVPLEVGASGAGAFNLATGYFYRAQLLSGIDGTVVFDADFTTHNSTNSFAEDSSNHSTVTVYGRAQGYEPTWLDPVAQYGNAAHYGYEMKKVDAPPSVPMTRYPTATGGAIYSVAM